MSNCFESEGFENGGFEGEIFLLLATDPPSLKLWRDKFHRCTEDYSYEFDVDGLENFG